MSPPGFVFFPVEIDSLLIQKIQRADDNMVALQLSDLVDEVPKYVEALN